MSEAGGREPVLLVVDDEPDIRDFVARLANRVVRGHRVLTACDAAAAETICREEPVRAILTDLRMPGRSGIELIARVRESAPATRCAIMTGFYEDVVDGVALSDLGLVAVARKPFTVTECTAILRKLASPSTP